MGLRMLTLPIRRIGQPDGQCRAFQLNALAGLDVALSSERQMIAVLGDENVRQQTGAGRAPLAIGRWGAAA